MTDHTSQQRELPGRRAFLKKLGIGAGAGVALAADPVSAGARTRLRKSGASLPVELLAGKAGPSKRLGKPGWFYIDERNHLLYGPKGKSGWGHGFSLAGSRGSAGRAGAVGATGAQGSAGATGAQGAAGAPGGDGSNGVVYPMLTGNGTPTATNTPERDGQPYLDLATGNLYIGEDGTWGSPVNIIPSSVATLGGDGTVGGAGGSPLAAKVLQQTRTIRAALPIGGNGWYVTDVGTYEWTQRVACILPATPTRFRFRILNYSASAEATGSATVTIAGIFIGAPQQSTSGARWNGQFASQPIQVVHGGGTTGGDTEYVSPWVTNAGHIVTGQPFGVSLGATTNSGTLRYDVIGDPLYWEAAGASGQAGLAGRPTLGTAAAQRPLDIRLEYEVLTTASQGKKMIAALGDSITSGGDGGDGGPATYETWPGQAALRTGHHFVNMGVWGGQATQIASDYTSATSLLWNRFDLSTTVPDVAIVSLGTNDVDEGTSAVAIQSALITIISVFQSIGVGQIYLGTMIPRSYTGAEEQTRLAVNAWIRALPQGVAGIFDFDKVLSLRKSITTAVTLTSGATGITVTGPTGLGIQNGASVYGTGIPAGTTVSAGGGVGQTALTLSDAATVDGSQSLTFVNAGSQLDPELWSVGAHPLRGGYQQLASIIGAGLT